MKMILIMIRIK